MSFSNPVEYHDAAPEVQAVYDDIKCTRNVEDVNNFWKYLAHHPATLSRTWQSLKEVMAPGALDPLLKELVYVAVSVTNNCAYCVASHSAAARRLGMSDEMFGERLPCADRCRIARFFLARRCVESRDGSRSSLLLLHVLFEEFTGLLNPVNIHSLCDAG